MLTACIKTVDLETAYSKHMDLELKYYFLELKVCKRIVTEFLKSTSLRVLVHNHY